MSKFTLTLKPDGLFARKGEAQPTGIAVRDGSQPMVTFGRSPLSFLIQRRTVSEERSRPKDAMTMPETTALLDFAATGPVDPYAPVPRPLPAGSMPVTGDEPEPWKRVSVRVAATQHRQLRNLAKLWGVSMQRLLQKSVGNFLDAALCSEESEARH
jgi:hypothetical protein